MLPTNEPARLAVTTEQQPTLKLAGPDDVDALLPLVRAYHEFEHTHLSDAERAKALRPLLADESLGKIWLVCVDRRVVGYIALCWGYSIEFVGKDAFVDEFFIEEEWRGQGVGGAVLGQVCQYAAQLGVKALHLEVARDNQRARSVYEAQGFESRHQFHMMSRVL